MLQTYKFTLRQYWTFRNNFDNNDNTNEKPQIFTFILQSIYPVFELTCHILFLSLIGECNTHYRPCQCLSSDKCLLMAARSWYDIASSCAAAAAPTTRDVLVTTNSSNNNNVINHTITPTTHFAIAWKRKRKVWSSKIELVEYYYYYYYCWWCRRRHSGGPR